jgi:hypothetical protein
MTITLARPASVSQHPATSFELSLFVYGLLDARKAFVDIPHGKPENCHGDKKVEPQQHAAHAQKHDPHHRLVDEDPEQQEYQSNPGDDRR